MIIILLFCLAVVHTLLSFLSYFGLTGLGRNLFFVFPHTPVLQICCRSSKYPCSTPTQLRNPLFYFAIKSYTDNSHL